MRTPPRVLIVGDVVENRADAVASRSFDVDKPTRAELKALVGWLEDAGYHVDVHEDVAAFVRSPPATRDMIVFPLWRGGASRNRTAVVPAVCEELGINYVGGDVLVQTVCQDKSLSKVFARDAGITTPGEWRLPNATFLDDFRPSERLKLPVVIKPQYSAASLGVEDDCLCHTNEQAQEVAARLLGGKLGSVVCEEFVAGDEISLCYIEEGGRLVERCVATFFTPAGVYPWRDRLFTYDEKAREDDGVEVALWPTEVDPALWAAAERLNRLLGRVDYMRIDGRLDQGRFTLIELTQDPHMGTISEFLGGFELSGIDPSATLDRLIRASLKNQASQSTNWT
jgi:D-alanine-D-alanine ligase